MEKITSVANEKIRHLIQLRDKSSVRRSERKFIIEGFREVERALASGLKFTQAYWCPKYDKENRLQNLNLSGNQITEIGESVFAKLAYREFSDGIIIVAEFPDISLNRCSLPQNPLILVVEAIEKPGNLGAIMRTVDAAAIDLVIICDPLADVFNPNVIRSSIGCIFSSQIAVCNSHEALQYLKEKGIQIFAAVLSETANTYTEQSYENGSAIVVGTEATGLTDIWTTGADSHVMIPMRGIADSLNVSVSAAIIIFEALRQRVTK